MLLIGPPLVADTRFARFPARLIPNRRKYSTSLTAMHLGALYDCDEWRNIETAFRHGQLGRVQQAAWLAAECASTEQLRVAFLDLATRHSDTQIRSRLVHAADAQHRIVAGTSGRTSGLHSIAQYWDQNLHSETVEQYRRTCIAATSQRSNSDVARLASATGQLLVRKGLSVALRLRSDMHTHRDSFSEIYACLDESWNCASSVAASMVATGDFDLPKYGREVNRTFRRYRAFFTNHAQI